MKLSTERKPDRKETNFDILDFAKNKVPDASSNMNITLCDRNFEINWCFSNSFSLSLAVKRAINLFAFWLYEEQKKQQGISDYFSRVWREKTPSLPEKPIGQRTFIHWFRRPPDRLFKTYFGVQNIGVLLPLSAINLQRKSKFRLSKTSWYIPAPIWKKTSVGCCMCVFYPSMKSAPEWKLESSQKWLTFWSLRIHSI